MERLSLNSISFHHFQFQVFLSDEIQENGDVIQRAVKMLRNTSKADQRVVSFEKVVHSLN